jgi:hypothetical protein
MGWMAEELGFDFQRARHFLFSIASRLALRHTQPPIHLVLGAVSMRVKQSGHKMDYSYPSDEVKNALNYTSTPSYVINVMIN